MIEDIVTRLRQEVCKCPYSASFNELHKCLRCEAIDEIELLREWKELAYQMRNKYWWAMRGKTLKEFDAMHKADWARRR